MLYVFEGVHQMLLDEQERTGKSSRRLRLDFVKASRSSSIIQEAGRCRYKRSARQPRIHAGSPCIGFGNMGVALQVRSVERCAGWAAVGPVDTLTALVELHWTDERIVECT